MYIIPRNRDMLWPETSLLSSLRHGLLPEYLGLRSQEEEATGSTWNPPMDFVENKDRYVLYADAPGMKKEDIDISFKDGILYVEGTREHEKEIGNGGVKYLLERRCGNFMRHFHLRVGIEEDKIEADYTNGVLKVTIPKSTKATARSIPIKAG